MRAFAVERFDEAPAIHDLQIPSGDGAFLIRVRYAGVNPIDYKLVEQLKPTSTFPYILGIDFAGVVERVPMGEIDLQSGDRVFGSARTYGAYAEYTAVEPGVKIEPVARIPDSVKDEEAAVLPIAALTALGSLELMSVTKDQWLVVMGATGGVGGFEVQMAHSRGAHVIATVRGDPDEARLIGADEVYDTRAIDVISAIRSAHPDGVDAVLDLVNGSEAIRRDAEILKSRASLVSTLYAVDEGWFAERQISAHNISSRTNPLSSPQGLEKIANMLGDGTITPRIRSTVGLNDAGQILEKLRSGGLHGKAVIRI